MAERIQKKMAKNITTSTWRNCLMLPENVVPHPSGNTRLIYRSDFIFELDQDYWEWIYNIGDVIPIRVQSYLIGLKMAVEQLSSNVA